MKTRITKLPILRPILLVKTNHLPGLLSTCSYPMKEMNPPQLSTRITEMGSFVHTPHYLPLTVDEATSALDNQTAQQINQVILDLEEVTRIVVTHRLERNILKQYDEVLVLKDGELIEHGKFDELMDRKQYFYSLFMVSN